MRKLPDINIQMMKVEVKSILHIAGEGKCKIKLMCRMQVRVLAQIVKYSKR